MAREVPGAARGMISMGKRHECGLGMPRLGQVGIVVRDIDTTTDYYQDVFGIGPWAVFEGEPESCIERGESITFKGKMAMAQAGPVQIELIQILEGRTLHSDFLGERDEGLHHLGFFVHDIEARLRAAKDAGIEIIHHGVLKQLGLKIEYAYLDTTKTGGVILEYIQSSFLGLPFPMRGPLLRLGAWFSHKMGM
jgi:catechol 2,3-dioxygenase-like lactoylglutathione lyase family enzyme